MNIGFFTDSYNPGFSGVETSIDSFKAELEKLGHTVYIFAPKLTKQKNTKEEKEQGIYRLQSMEQQLVPEFNITFPISPAIFKRFGKFQLDIIHSHTPFYMGLYANIVASTLNIPIVHTYHTFYEKYSGHSFIKNERGDKFIMQLVGKISKLHPDRCNLTIAPSEKMKKVLKEYGVTGDIQVLPTGIDITPIRNTKKGIFKKEFNIDPDKQIITTVSRIAREKNIEFLIESFKIISEKKPKTLFVIVGSGPALSKLKEKAKAKGLSEKILFTDHQPRNKVFEILKDSDIFIFASKTDTQSLSLSEAAAAKLPIIMVKDENLTEIIENEINGYEVEESEQVFAEHVLKLLDDNALRSKMNNASSEISEQYTAKKQTIKLLGMYLDVINDHVKHSRRDRLKKQLNKEVNFKEILNVEKNKAFFEKLSKRTKEFINRIKE